MQVSMRDIAVMGLTAGMKITDCSFKEKSLSMQGAIGTITSSNHPILGPILHFTPRPITSPLPRSLNAWGEDDRGIVNAFRLSRTWDVCTVGKVYFDSLKRRTTRRLDDRWTSYQEPGQYHRSQGHKRPFNMAGIVPVDPDQRQDRRKKKKKVKTPGRTKPTGSVSVSRRSQDGNWHIIEPRPTAQAPATEDIGDKEKEKDSEGTAEGPKATPVHQSASTTELKSSGERAASPAEELPQQVSSDGSTSQQAQVTGHGPVKEKTLEKHLDNSDNPAQNKAKGKGQSDDISAAPVAEPLVHGHQQKERTALKTDQDGDQSQSASLKPDEKNSGPPEISVGGSLSMFARPVPRLLLTQTPHWDALPEENPQDEGHQEPDIHPPRRRATVEDVPDSGDEVASEPGRPFGPESHDRGRAAKKRQEKRNKRSRKIQKDKAIVEESWASDTRSQFLLTYPQEGQGSEQTPKTKEDKAHAREAERRRRREERETERDRRNRSRGNVVSLNRMDMYWFCQVDIYQGFWATPWRSDAPIDTSLVGAVTVILEALLGFLEENVSLVYCRPIRFHTTRDWITYGGISYPAYASNARGGVIARGSYTGVRVPAFQYTVPALELLYSYEWQVSSYLHDQERYCEDLNIELMRIDAWLSYVGRTERIANGPTDLLKGAPALVQLLQADFEVDFMNIDLSAKEGGHQDIQGLADNVMDFLTDEELDEAEQLYILVALLRAVKVCQCVLAGSNTREMEEILMKDVQAHLV